MKRLFIWENSPAPHESGPRYASWRVRDRCAARCRRDGRSLSSARHEDIQTNPSFSVGKATQLPVQGTIHPVAQRNYDITPDGKQLLVVVPAASPADSGRRPNQQINVVLNWFEELKARVPVK